MDWMVIVPALVNAIAVILASLFYIHMLQLESYQGRMYAKWVYRHIYKPFPFYFIGALAGGALMAAFGPAIAWLPDMTAFCGLFAFFYLCRKTPSKKPLAYTGRIKRLISALAVLVAAVFSLSLLTGCAWIRLIPGALLPVTVFIAYALTYPIEEGVKKWYFNDARKKINRLQKLSVVGLTGSFGKTSTKFFLGTILSEKYNVLVTPASYNTPMGITKVIRGSLNESHDVFVAEMGARYVGDIEELCRLTSPQIGIITSVGKQHLETFGSYSNIIRTKGELLDALPASGAAFANGDNPDCVDMLNAAKHVKNRFLFGIHGNNLYMRAQDIAVGEWGSSFTLLAQNGETAKCKTQLLGEHNILNITGAAACAYYMGMPIEQISAGIKKLKPVEHRLELIPGPVTVIDDTFNANPAGVKAAVDVLKEFHGRRIIVTPGMVELGEEEDALNEEFGRKMASGADIVILVGKRHADPMEKGLKAEGFPGECIVRTDNLEQATAKLPLYAPPGSVVLFINDLPDNYNE